MTLKMNLCIYAAALLASNFAFGDTLPPKPKPEKIEVVGIQKSLTADTGRDLGFSGKIGSTILNTYGDTARCGLGPQWNLGCGYPGASNSMAQNMADGPLSVKDYAHYLQDGWVQQFCDTYEDEPRNNGQFAIGITNILPVSDTEGMLFYLINNRTTPSLSNFPGSGVARIDLSKGYPTCNRLKNEQATGRASEFWWGPTEPAFGDHAAVLGPDGYLYGMGGMSNAATGADKSLHDYGLYMTRVKQEHFADWSAYEYWHGKERGWTRDRLYNPTAEATVLGKVGQGSMMYSPHFGGYLFMYSFAGGLVARLAYRPEGPWSDEFNTLYDMGCISFGCSYTPSIMPWWDDSGKSLYVQYSHAGSYDLNVIKITWPGAGRQSADAFPYAAGFQVNAHAEAGGSSNSSDIQQNQPSATDAAPSVSAPSGFKKIPKQSATQSPSPTDAPTSSNEGDKDRDAVGSQSYQGQQLYGSSDECGACGATVTTTVTVYATPTPWSA